MAIPNSSNKVMSGARAVLGFYDGQNFKPAGIFNNVSWGFSIDAQPVFTLGRFSAASIEYTGVEVVSITASGWRIVDHGPHDDGGVPTLGELLTHDYLQLVIVDRLTEKRIATFRDVKPTNYSTSLSQRALEEMSITFMAIYVDDELNTQAESPGATQLP